ncbi:MAG: MSHA pilin protein MshC [Alteromonadaceae bacterium]|jgi:MSHA pilin protein MshC
MNKQHGFTLVELITVIILIGILAMVALPKINGSDDYEVYPFRAQLISALRLTQQRAMQYTDTNKDYCHQIVFDDAKVRYGVPDKTDCDVTIFPVSPEWQADLTGAEVDSRYDITFDIDDKPNPKKIRFDYMGRPLDDCANGCLINITQTTTAEIVTIKVESEGFIHAL